jgi:hypothetical protein
MKKSGLPQSTSRTALALAALVLVTVVTVPARAWDEQWHFGGGVGAATFAGTDSAWAPAAGLHVAYDLNDMFDGRVELLGSQHQFVDGVTTRFYSVAAGFTYKVDVSDWVPYAGILGAIYAFDGEVWPRQLKQRELGISIPIGLDYALSHSVGLGAQLRYHGFLSDPLSSLGDAPYFSALLRAEVRVGG